MSGGGIPAVYVNGVAFAPGAGREVVIGRDPSSDVVVDHRLVSRRHAAVVATAEGWIVRDLGSHNGTFAGSSRVTEIAVPASLNLRLGSPDDGAPVDLALEDRAEPPAAGAPANRSAARHPVTIYEVATARTRIGRAPDNDIVLGDDLRVSRYHAEIHCFDSGSWSISDLDSHNGTFVNGARAGRCQLREGDIVSVGNHVFRFAAGNLVERAEDEEASLQVAGLSAWSDSGTQLLDDVSFSLGPASLLAVVGPSGVGKTSLVNALTGFRPAADGAVFFAGRDLYGSYEDLRRRMGYVPQDDIVHTDLGARQALLFAARLRFPADVDATEREARVDEVLAELGLSQRSDLRISRLSGGQRKRVSVGLELLTRPALLICDEPTSGLDPGNEEHVMRLLRQLADGGRIVVVVTHSTQSLDLADRVLYLAPGGRVAYYGTPKEATAYFARERAGDAPAQVFRSLEEEPDRDWHGRFRADTAYDEHVRRPLAAAEIERGLGAARRPLPARPELGWARQVAVLAHRQIALIRNDRRTLVMLAAQAPLFGLIDLLLFPSDSMSTSRGPFAALLVWLLVMGATWLGMSNTVREIVKEHHVYRRERSVGLSVGAYVTSKAVVFGGIAVVQAVVLFVVGMMRQSLPPSDPEHVVASLRQAVPQAFAGLSPFTHGAVLSSPGLELAVDVVLSALAATTLGLLISATVRTSDQSLVVLPVVLVAEMALSMPLLIMQNPNPAINVLGVLSSTQWGTAAGAATVSLNQLMTSYQLSLTAGNASLSYALGHPLPRSFVTHQALRAVNGFGTWRHAPGPWLSSTGLLVVLLAVAFAATWLTMRRRDTNLLAGVGRTRNGGCRRAGAVKAPPGPPGGPDRSR